jgi:hypothetical protein
MANEIPVQTPTEKVAESASTSTVDGKPSDVIADAAKNIVDEKEETTLLGKEEDKKSETISPPAKVIPEKYDIKAPEGMTIDVEMMDKITPVFKELGITQEGAQKLADTYAPYVNSLIDNDRKASVDTFKTMVNEWKQETIKELGAEYQKDMGIAAKFIDRFGSPKLREILNETGLGNNVELVKAFIKAGKEISEDSFQGSSTKIKSVDTDESRAKVLYPSMEK